MAPNILKPHVIFHRPGCRPAAEGAGAVANSFRWLPGRPRAQLWGATLGWGSPQPGGGRLPAPMSNSAAPGAGMREESM